MSAYSKNAWLAFGLTVAAAGTAYAAIPDANGVIRGCYNVLTGSARIVDGGSCNLLERSISWQQTGPRGPAGAQGPVGPQGPAGESKLVIGWGRVSAPLPLVDQVASVQTYVEDQAVTAPADGECLVSVTGTQAEFTGQASFRVTTRRNDGQRTTYPQTAVPFRTETRTGSDFTQIQSASITDIIRVEAGHSYNIGVSLQNEPPTLPTVSRSFGFAIGWTCKFDE